MKVLSEIKVLSDVELDAFIDKHAARIVRQTQGECWDDPEEWQSEAVDLAHAVYERKQRGCRHAHRTYQLGMGGVELCPDCGAVV